MGRHYDLAVVGGGVVGLGHAVAALRRGLTVAVIERARGVNGASIRNFGHLCVTPQEGEARTYAELARELWLMLAPEAGFWLRESGTVVVAQAADELAVLEEFRDRRGVQDVRLLTPAEVRERVPAGGGVVGGALLPADLQVDPREAAPAIARWLDAHGVDFFWQTTVTGVETGRVYTSRGRVSADAVVVAVNHDVDQLFPGIAEAHGILRCGLDMMLVDADLDRPLSAPVLTGWSLLRYGGFAATPSAPVVRERLAEAHPELAALDVNQMYTQRPDDSLIVGDTHYRDADVPPFQSEPAFELLLEQTRALFGVERLRVRERWQGVYASAPDDFLVASPAPSVRVVSVTTGIGMTTGLGLADRVVDDLFSSVPRVPVPAAPLR
ncbi:phytoene dehydrogenase [Leifsonia xyli subsp. cynodontis DSM 46306]|uniref:FAD dependent oxidoreductase domain-containing protein n=1 Tax=Leifsonia xyli subsp. cynodontis DSM 46306 TaxID=1389489 RepID=U3PG16_LEIXC|nr:TIGR03364 family FAD-dependent oxidoreductase [Leifsonia xyli]AGW42613.1 phytoene dehydrogenase [Leifsonia xyli subsp. cynodontis DSM 46306]